MTIAATLATENSCPLWCDIEDHKDYDAGTMHHTLCWTVPVSAYPYEIQDEEHFDHINVSRVQVGDREPVILLEPPAAEKRDNADGLVTVSGQFTMTGAEAADLAAALLKMSGAPEKLVQQVFTYIECRDRELEYKHFSEGYAYALECAANRLEWDIRDGRNVTDLIARMREEAHEEGERVREIVISD